MISKLFGSIVVAAAVASFWIVPAAAQTAPDSSAQTPAVATLLQGGTMGELLAINVPRSQDDIQRLIDEARRLEKTAAEEIESGRQLAIKAEDRTKIMKSELENTKTRRDAAKKEKDKVQAGQYDQTAKKQSQELRYLTQLSDAVKADADRLESAKSAANATAKALEKELDVVRKQAELGAGTPTPEAIAQYRNMLRDMLQSQRDAASKAQIASDKKKKLAEQRLKQLDALGKL